MKKCDISNYFFPDLEKYLGEILKSKEPTKITQGFGIENPRVFQPKDFQINRGNFSKVG